MFQRLKTRMRKRLDAVSVRRWNSMLESAETIDLGTLKQQRQQARQLRSTIDRFAHIADGRLALPRIGSNSIRKSSQSDWAFRPEIWRGPISPFGVAAIQTKTPIGTAAMLYHDCHTSEITVRQVRNARENDLAPFGLRVDVFKFDGSFLSLMLELDDAAVMGLRANHIMTLSAEVETEKPLEMFARLNIKYGPNVEQMVREIQLGDNISVTEFDLAQTRMNEKRLERIWVDLIFDGPEFNEINVRDITFTRRPRAEF